MGRVFCLIVGLFRLLAVTLLSSTLLLISATPGIRNLVRWWLTNTSKSRVISEDDTSKKIITVGFFHPYCNAGGGGERVLWVAIRALQKRYDFIKCVIYTGDTEAKPEQILKRARDRFNISLVKPVEFVYLHRRQWVEDSKYPHFTLLGQSLGSVLLGWEALTLFVPDIFIDTMGYAFTLPLFKNIGGCRVGCYVHYPTISTDMLSRVSQRVDTYNNASFVSRSPLLSSVKLCYYKMFAALYGVMGRQSDLIMTNSSWTQGHILHIWQAPEKTHIVYPPCDTKEFIKLPVNCSMDQTSYSIVSVAQFRPEKDHKLQLLSFKRFLSSLSKADQKKYTLVLVGGCRNDGDRQRVEELQELCDKLDLSNFVSFKLNVPFDELKQYMSEATIGLHTMWNEHFGIGVVELMAAGTVVLAHNSGGPKMDIVTRHNGKITGYLAHDEESYAEAMKTIFDMSLEERLDLIENARDSVDRFSDEEFHDGFLAATESLFNHI